MSDADTPAETTTPGRGSPESAAWFRAKLAELGLTQTSLARLMIERGDDRQLMTIQRTVGRMATGHARVSGEMRALLGTLAPSPATDLRSQVADLVARVTAIELRHKTLDDGIRAMMREAKP